MGPIELLENFWIDLLKYDTKLFYQLNDKSAWYPQGSD